MNMRLLTYCGALILGVAFVSLSLKEPDSAQYVSFPALSEVNSQAESDIQSPEDALLISGSSNLESSATPPSDYPEADAPYLILGDKLLSLGEGVDSLIRKLGIPGRIADTEYDFDFYVYNRDYRNLIFVAVKNDLIEGFYTDSLLFNFKGIASGSSLKEVNRVLNSNHTPADIISYETEGYNVMILMDHADTGLVTGIYVLSKNVTEDGYDDSVMKNAELLNYDLANSLRIRNGLPAFAWSSTAAIASRKHSTEMAEKDYFDHISLDGKLPGDRLREEGISVQRVGENIIAGYGSAILSNHAWFNSPGHRKNLLNPDYICLGVGFVYDEDSTYKTYMTQNFYK